LDSISPGLSAEGCIRALKTALNNNPVLGRLIHHSDRGSQYCCFDYVKILNDNFIKISMTQNGDPRENAIAERVNGILKDELLDKVYLNYREAVRNISIAISTYNHQRAHGSIDYLTPFEAHFREGKIFIFRKNRHNTFCHLFKPCFCV
jgi:putative transposase